MGSKKTFLELILHRVECEKCAHLYWPVLPIHERDKANDKILDPISWRTTCFWNNQDVAEFLGFGWNTIKRIHKSDLQAKYNKIPLEHVKYVSIKEIKKITE